MYPSHLVLHPRDGGLRPHLSRDVEQRGHVQQQVQLLGELCHRLRRGGDGLGLLDIEPRHVQPLRRDLGLQPVQLLRRCRVSARGHDAARGGLPEDLPHELQAQAPAGALHQRRAPRPGAHHGGPGLCPRPSAAAGGSRSRSSGSGPLPAVRLHECVRAPPAAPSPAARSCRPPALAGCVRVRPERPSGAEKRRRGAGVQYPIRLGLGGQRPDCFEAEWLPGS